MRVDSPNQYPWRIFKQTSPSSSSGSGDGLDALIYIEAWSKQEGGQANPIMQRKNSRSIQEPTTMSEVSFGFGLIFLLLLTFAQSKQAHRRGAKILN
jgi:hypothetical protein